MSAPSGGGPCLFARVLGRDFARLPMAVRAAHDPAPAVVLSGVADVEGPAGPVAVLVAKLFGFPPAQAGAAARVLIERTSRGELWTRRFGDAVFRSRVEAGAAPGRMVERFGPFAFELAIHADETGFRLTLDGWRCLGAPLPARLAPRSAATAVALPDGAYGFDVAVDLPLAGRLARYRGRLTPD